MEKENEMLKRHIEAGKIADGIIEQIKIVDNSLNYGQVLKLAIYTADRMKSVIPMYIGNLNPKWKLFDTVIEILKSKEL